ncbi:MAG TPA: class F sortase [Candidatus Saccharimonadales bacterium]|nr:class F sortase [Candidatus Saccharimonadales bacterium]
MISYAKWRRPFFWVIVLLIIGVIGLWVYKDFFMPSTPQSSDMPRTISTDSARNGTPPNDNEVHSYTVPAEHPRRMTITSVGINTLVKPVGITAGGALDAPKTAWDVGWYKDSGLPGRSGAMLIDGHVNDSYNTPGVFADLKKTKPGDKITVERGDGAIVLYSIVTVEQIPLAQVDMKRLLKPIQGSEGLNLITCGGSYDKKAATYSDRILVFAKRA